MSVELIVKNCSELHTMRGPRRARVGEEMKNTGLIEDGALAVDEDKILDVGNTKEIEKKYDAEKIVDASGKTVIPGFVDPHTHLVYAGSREDELIMKIRGKTYMEILEAGGGISRTVKATRSASKEELKEAMRKRMDKMLEYGTTTAEAKSGYGLDLENEIKSLEVIKDMSDEHPIDVVPTYLGAHSLPPEFDNTKEYIDYCVREVLPKVKEKGLAEFCDVFCEKGVFDAEESQKLLKKAKVLGLKVKVHADEIENIGCSKMASEVGAISAEHLVKTSDSDIERMAEAGTIGILLPGTPFMLMEDEYSPARKMIEKGMPVALATDLNPNCWTESMQMIITLACLQMKMTPSEALTASTVNAARALDRKDIGVLQEGKRADFLILDVPNHMHIPYRFGVNLVEEVYKSGKKIDRDN
ncbi:MAG: imidazolonepropionase [Candidatus Thermoplasmatota archaeon]|nr:imidazolonepropionase [Candidatus Thermoplasmatota archaeon]